jgi:hypothetical protein
LGGILERKVSVGEDVVVVHCVCFYFLGVFFSMELLCRWHVLDLIGYCWDDCEVWRWKCEERVGGEW